MRTLLVLSFLFLCFIPSLQAQEWKTNFAEAKALAAKEDKPIVLVFQGSDWCAPCIKLEREVFSTEEFRNYAKDHYVLLKADFPRKKQNALPPEQEAHNKALAEKYNTGGYFPLVVVLDKEGKVLGETGYKKVSPREYINLLNAF